MKSKLKYLLSALLLVSFVYSCKSLEEQGEELYSKGQYEAALSHFEKAARLDPSNASAQVWVQKTRTKIIDKSLLEVRFLRLGNNKKAATDKLESILRRQEKWQVLYTGALMSSQKKEVREANDYLISMVKESEIQETPSYIKWIEYEYNRTIAAGDCQAYLLKIYPKLQAKAQRKYHNLINSLNRQSFFASDVIESYASLWKIPSRPVLLQQNDLSRFSSLEIENRIKNEDPRKFKLKGLHKELKKTFENSLFFFSNSKETLKLKLTGRTSYNRHHHLESRVATYRVPYTVWEWREKKVFVPENDDSRNLYKYGPKSSKNFGNDSVMVEREKVPVHRYKEKNFPYQVLVYHEKYTAHVNGFFKNRPKFSDRINFSYAPENSTEAHDISMREANISPVSPNFLNKNYVKDHTVKGFAEKFQKALSTEWKKRYCSASSKYDTESIHRCALVAPYNEGVKQWYMKNFGVDRHMFKTLLSER